MGLELGGTRARLAHRAEGVAGEPPDIPIQREGTGSNF